MSWEVRQGHVLELLRQMPAESVHCVVTSPPYWGLRSYKTEPQVWGGEQHEHEWGHETFKTQQPQTDHDKGTRGEEPNRQGAAFTASQGAVCSCGAWRGELGLEPTPELFVQHIVEVFREVKRVLRKDGTLWMNLGDSYAHSTSGGGGAVDVRTDGRKTTPGDQVRGRMGGANTLVSGLKPKDLCGIPWRVAFALQADGWWLRSDIIWAKPNPMPESVTDRPTKAHEYLFLLAKSQSYYFDQEAVREPQQPCSVERAKYRLGGFQKGELADKDEINYVNNPNTVEQTRLNALNGLGRNLRTVWTIATQAFPDAHFATFPEKLVEPCIRAGTSEKGCCAKCGAPWEREVKKQGGTTGKSWHDYTDDLGREQQKHEDGMDTYSVETLGWHPTCSHQADTIPCTVLEPFCGSGTTGVVALKLGRSFIGLELNPSYVEMAKKRIGGVMPLFDGVEC